MDIFRKMRDIRFSKQASVISILGLLMILTLSGCQIAKETFGKEYLMIDDSFEQLEADVEFSLEEYAVEQGLTAQDLADKQIYLDQIIADLHVMRDELKNGLRSVEAMQDEAGTNMSVEAYIEQAIVEYRITLREELEKASDGALTLKSTEVDRGFLGGVWHFIRKHWLISLIILGIIGSIPEAVEDFLSKKKKKSGSI